MCLILFAYRAIEGDRLVVAANRDEFYERPTRTARFWPENAGLLAGKDLEAGGTWLGITRSGRFAAVTNYRETPPDPLPPKSRGGLTLDFLVGAMSPGDYIHTVARSADQYRGFNLLVGDDRSLLYYSNRDAEIRSLGSGVYGLSNHLLDCDWPKVVEGRCALRELLARGANDEQLLALLSERGDPAQPLSARFIASPRYGTRSSTILRVTAEGEVTFRERNFAAEGLPSEELDYTFTLTG